MDDTGGCLEEHLSTASQKENMDRKEIQSSLLQFVRYIRKNGDGKKRDTKNRLADPEIHAKKIWCREQNRLAGDDDVILKMQFALQKN